MKNIYLLIFALILSVSSLEAQEDDLLSLLGEDEPTVDFTTATFKTNRVINLHSVENTAGGVLDFKINHRFSPLDQGIYDIFGLDGASVRFSTDYGITDRLQIGLGRSTWEKTYDGYLKYKVLRQSTGKKKMPITASIVTAASVNTLKDTEPENVTPFWDRFSYTTQIILGRKFNEGFSLQLSPTLVHRNLVGTREENNDILALGIGLRQKITKRTSINFEYILTDGLPEANKNSMSIGVDIETGGHVFQLHFTNSRYMFEESFITQTQSNLWGESGIMFGFNISRVFTLRD